MCTHDLMYNSITITFMVYNYNYIYTYIYIYICIRTFSSWRTEKIQYTIESSHLTVSIIDLGRSGFTIL